MQTYIHHLSIFAFSFIIILSTSGCFSLSPEEKAARREAVRMLEEKAKSGELLTVREWETLLRQNGSHNMTPNWLFALIGRPDETVKDVLSRKGVYLVYKNKLLDGFTGKPASLVFETSYGYIAMYLYDEDAVKKVRP